MKRLDKNLFNKKFDSFFTRYLKAINAIGLSEKAITKRAGSKGKHLKGKRLNKDYHYRLMYKNFEKLLCSGLSVQDSLDIIFAMPNQMVSNQEMFKKRKQPMIKYWLGVISYFLENDVSEYRACQYGLRKYQQENKNSKSKKFKQDKYQKQINSFIETFRTWYNTFENQLLHPDIFFYKNKLEARKKV